MQRHPWEVARAAFFLRVLRRPFATRWLFDVEFIARLIASRRGTGQPQVDKTVYEFPLHEWQDVAGSKVRPRDFVKACFELASIYWRYGRTATERSRPSTSTVPEAV